MLPCGQHPRPRIHHQLYIEDSEALRERGPQAWMVKSKSRRSYTRAETHRRRKSLRGAGSSASSPAGSNRIRPGETRWKSLCGSCFRTIEGLHPSVQVRVLAPAKKLGAVIRLVEVYGGDFSGGREGVHIESHVWLHLNSSAGPSPRPEIQWMVALCRGLRGPSTHPCSAGSKKSMSSSPLAKAHWPSC